MLDQTSPEMSNAGFDLGKALPTLMAPRVHLRWITEEDLESLFAIFGDAEVTRYWGHGRLRELSAAQGLLNDIRAKFAQRSLFQWGVALRETDALIGTCTLASLDAENRRTELGFALAQKYWGQGYMSEAAPAFHLISEMRLRPGSGQERCWQSEVCGASPIAATNAVTSSTGMSITRITMKADS